MILAFFSCFFLLILILILLIAFLCSRKLLMPITKCFFFFNFCIYLIRGDITLSNYVSRNELYILSFFYVFERFILFLGNAIPDCFLFVPLWMLERST